MGHHCRLYRATKMRLLACLLLAVVASVNANAEPEAEADPYYLYSGYYGYARPYGYGYYGYRPYYGGYYGYGGDYRMCLRKRPLCDGCMGRAAGGFRQGAYVGGHAV